MISGQNKPSDKKTFSNPIDSILKVIKSKSDDHTTELFNSTESDTDLRSDVVYPEDICICALKSNDDFLSNRGISPNHTKFINDFLRVRFSLDRGSRREFVDINKSNHIDDNLSKLGSIKNLPEVRK
jgi:hypothetical protein